MYDTITNNGSLRNLHIPDRIILNLMQPLGKIWSHWI